MMSCVLPANESSQLLNQRDDWKSGPDRFLAQRPEIDFVWIGGPGDLLRGCLGNDTDTRFSTRQGSLHFNKGPNVGLVAQ